MGWNKWKNTVYVMLIFLLAVGSVFIIYNFKDNKFNVKLGLDLRSGSHIVLKLKPVMDPNTKQVKPLDYAIVEQTKRVYEKRLNPMGNREIIIQKEGTDRLIIDIPEETNIQAAEALIRKTARLEFKEQKYNPATKTQEWVTVMDGSRIKSAMATFQSGGTAPIVSFELDKEGAKQFAVITERLYGKPLGIFFDKQEISAPIVQAVISDRGQISGGKMDLKECQELATLLNAGALPVDVEILESMTVSPTLGKESLMKSLWAGFLGLGLVIVFMLWWYRLPGFFADLALVFYGLVVLASMVVGNFVLTLPGIAGFILSIGMAVDANVLIFERLKEELWDGKALKNASDNAFKRAFSAILDSHVTTFMGAALLYYFGSSSIKGFGLTLMLGTFFSLFTAVFVTHAFMNMILEKRIIASRSVYGE